MILRACGWAAQFVKAILLLAMAVCGGEVGLRVWEMYAPEHSPKPKSSLATLMVPSAKQYLEFMPRTERTWNGQNDLSVRFRTNSFGGRGEEPRIPKTNGTFRIVWFGNETVLGPNVSEGMSPPQLLQEQLQARSQTPIEVLNAGFPDNCPLLMAIQHANSWATAEADLILIHVDRHVVDRDRQLRRYAHATAEGRPLCCVHPSLLSSGASQTARDWRERWRLIDLTIAWTAHLWQAQTAQKLDETHPARKRLGSYSDPDADHPLLTGAEHSLKPILAILETAGRAGTPVVIVTCPKAKLHEDDLAFSRVLADFCQTHRLPLVNVTSAWDRAPSQDSLVADSQQELSIEGLRFHASSVAQTLLINWPGPWKSSSMTPHGNDPTHPPQLTDSSQRLSPQSGISTPPRSTTLDRQEFENATIIRGPTNGRVSPVGHLAPTLP
ncbi:MAG: hypothetical protein C0478_04205 [Planctomyces sp.]|jgi:hypothetical protein|nr:hypothetical protein [Planctomyces sp.]